PRGGWPLATAAALRDRLVRAFPPRMARGGEVRAEDLRLPCDLRRTAASPRMGCLARGARLGCPRQLAREAGHAVCTACTTGFGIFARVLRGFWAGRRQESLGPARSARRDA